MTAIDTTFLIDLYWLKSPRHNGAVNLFKKIFIEEKEEVVIFSYVFNEFIHKITDSKIFDNCISVKEAVLITDTWRSMENVKIVYVTEESFVRFLAWLNMYSLGRNRLNDTGMAACYASCGASRLITANASDFETFRCFELVKY